MKCDGCKRDKPDVRKRRQNTAYVDDESNFATLCDECQEMADEYWADMWADYYSGCM